MRILELGEFLKDLDHLIGSLAARSHNHNVRLGLLRDSMLEHRLTGTKGPGDKPGTTLHHGIGDIDTADPGLE